MQKLTALQVKVRSSEKFRAVNVTFSAATESQHGGDSSCIWDTRMTQHPQKAEERRNRHVDETLISLARCTFWLLNTNTREGWTFRLYRIFRQLYLYSNQLLRRCHMFSFHFKWYLGSSLHFLLQFENKVVFSLRPERKKKLWTCKSEKLVNKRALKAFKKK